MKRCTKKDKKEKKSTSKSIKMKQCSKKLKSWEDLDLDLDLLGEIKKKLYWGDDVRFGGVCKTWQAAEHEKRAGDVLPWLLFLSRNPNVNKVSYDLYQPNNLDPDQPLISGGTGLTLYNICHVLSIPRMEL
ncbi:F-box protein At3g56470-like isoform X3 [Apium graveolens]|uniref:F-box protein At3g56470-like isoform X3 n=1 Tax=Apium graveolens TaxID=4045 RepID=UPI003D7A7808